jgi:O-antigen/teichoic acid export membrane protein
VAQQYRSILKATSIFGGTQVIQILVGLVRSKFVAILIGATGMGLSSMYMSSLWLFITIFGLGLNSSVVRDLSKAHDEGDEERFAKVTKVFRRLLLVLSLLGTICVISCSSYLSNWAFKSSDYAYDYCFLSLIVYFTLLSQGNTAVLVSSRRIKETAMCTLIGSIANLVTSVPLFYFFGMEGIVPGLVVSTFANYIVTYFYARRVKLEKVDLKREDFKIYGKTMIVLGFAMIISSLMANATQYLINISITRLGGLKDLGLFNAGMSVTMQAVSLIFAAMSADYYPRLVASLSDNQRMNDTINQQSEIIIYLAVPVLAVFMVLSPIIIAILLSSEFQVITNFIRILCLGMFFKAVSYALGYVAFAKGDKYVYVSLEGFYGNILNLILSVGMYYLWGLTGLAYSFLIDYLQYFFVVSFVCRKKYKYRISKDLPKIILISAFSLGILLILALIMNAVSYYIVGGLLSAGIVYYYIKKLNEKTALLQTIRLKIANGRGKCV